MSTASDKFNSFHRFNTRFYFTNKMNVSKVSQLYLRAILKHENLQKIGINSRRLYTGRYTMKQQGRQLRQISAHANHLTENDGILKKLIKKIPFLNVDKSRIMASAYLIYENIADKVNYIRFFDELDLPDTFYSWFVITELHIWMVSVRAMAEGDNGRHLRNFLMEALWNDVAQRVKKLEASNPSVAREQVKDLSEQLQAALIAYDEGLDGDDTILAGALWRRFYQQMDVDPRCLEILVRYVRKQIRLLDHQSFERIASEKLDWTPLN